MKMLMKIPYSLIIQGCRKVCGGEVSKRIKRIRFPRVS